MAWSVLGGGWLEVAMDLGPPFVVLLFSLVVACRARVAPPSPPDAAPLLPDPDLGGSDEKASVEAMTVEFAARWQGAWVLRDATSPGSVEAWLVHGGAATIYDASRRTRHEASFSLSSPCRVARTWSLDGGRDVSGESRGNLDGAITTTDTFAFASDGLHVALAFAAGGHKRGTLLALCIDEHLYTFDTGRDLCRRWAPMMNGFMTPRGECSIDKGVATSSFVFRPTEGGTSMRLEFDGDALLSPTLQAQLAQSEPSFRVAIQRADALVRP